MADLLARLPTVTVPRATLRLPTPSAAAATGLERAGALIAQIGLRNQQAKKVNDLNERKLQILQGMDAAGQAADAADVGTQIDTFGTSVDSVRADIEQEPDDEVRTAALLTLEASQIRMMPKIRALESAKLVDRANGQWVELRSISMALGTIGTNGDFQAVISNVRTFWDSRLTAGTADEGPAAAEIKRFEGELVQNRVIELAGTDPEAAKELLRSGLAIENLPAASRASIGRAVEAKRIKALAENALTLFDAGRRRLESLALDEHFDPEQYNAEATLIAKEIVANETVRVTEDEMKLALLQEPLANAAQTGNWPLVQKLKAATRDTLAGQTAFDKAENSALVKIRTEMRATVLQAAADGQTTLEAVQEFSADAGQRFVKDPKDPLALPPDVAIDLVNRSAALLENKNTEDALGAIYRANMVLPGRDTKATQTVVDQEFVAILSDALAKRGGSRDPAANTPADIVLATGEALAATNVTGVFPTAVKDGIKAGLRSVGGIDIAVDLATQAQNAAAATYKTQISFEDRAMVRQYKLLREGGASREDAFKAATESVFEVKPGRAVALKRAQQTGFHEDAARFLLEALNEEFDLDIKVKDVVTKGLRFSDQISAQDVAVFYESLGGAFLRTSERAGGRERAIEEATELFLRTHGVTSIDSQPRLMKFPPENVNIYGRGKKSDWHTPQMRDELAQDLIELHDAGNLELPPGVAPPPEPARKVPTLTPFGGVPAQPFFVRSDEQLLEEKIRLWSGWIAENTVLEADTANVTLSRLGPKPQYILMVIDEDGTETSVNIRRGNLAAVPFLFDFEYDDSRAGLKAMADKKEEERLRPAQDQRSLEWQRRIAERRADFGLSGLTP